MISRSIIAVGVAICLPGLPAIGQVAAFSGTLSNYLALDESGVMIGDAVFSDFEMLPLQQGASGFGTQFINVVPLTSASPPPA